MLYKDLSDIGKFKLLVNEYIKDGLPDFLTALDSAYENIHKMDEILKNNFKYTDITKIDIKVLL